MTAKTLCDLTKDREDVGVLVVSRENYFAFCPMVPGIIGSEVDFGNIAQPLRRPLIEAGTSFRRAYLKGVDFERKLVITEGGKEFPYDHLVVAMGSQPNFFDVPGVMEHSLALGGLAGDPGRDGRRRHRDLGTLPRPAAHGVSLRDERPYERERVLAGAKHDPQDRAARGGGYRGHVRTPSFGR
jgi:NADPH-dependent 2,4-dienoyl-CoA reductase/sulfur reductase-like enzyme